MNTRIVNKRRRRVAVATLIVPLLFLALGCGPDSGLQGPIPEDVPVQMKLWKNGAEEWGLFEATGGINDEGPVERSLMNFEANEAHGYRVLKGKEGEIYLDLHTRKSEAFGQIAVGTFTIRSGTGVYEGIQGYGEVVIKRDYDGTIKEVLKGCCNGQH